MTGGAERYVDRGIIPRTLSYVFNKTREKSDTEYKVRLFNFNSILLNEYRSVYLILKFTIMKVMTSWMKTIPQKIYQIFLKLFLVKERMKYKIV